MKVIEEIGIKKTIRFILYSLLQVVYHHIVNHLLFFPNFRKFFLQLFGAKIDKDTILMDVKFINWHHLGPAGLKIGEKCFLADEVLLDLYNSIILEDHVTLAQRVLVLTHTNVGYKDHPLQEQFPKKSSKVIFKTGCVVGAGSIILPGVVIGKKSFIGAGSVVTNNVPDGSLYTGTPAKLVRKFN